MSDDVTRQFRELARKTPKIDLAVFAGRVGGRLLDNVKYCYRHCVLTPQPFRPVFLTHYESEHRQMERAGLPSVLFPSEEALLILPQARVVVADDFWWKVNTSAYFLLSQAATLQIWHGVPLKLIGFPEIESSVNMTPEKARHLRSGYSGYNAVVSTSPYVTRTSLGRVFQCDEIWETGYPRNDVLFREPDAVDLMGVDRIALDKVLEFRERGFKIVFVMPTFRDTGGDPFQDGALDIGELEALGRRHNILFLLKFHPYISMTGALNTAAVHLVRSESDPYPLLRLVDCLVTDYSSVAYDFLLTDKPLIFFPYDLEKYRSRDREMFYHFEAMAPGPRPVDRNGLIAALLSVLVHGRDEHSEARAALRDKLFTDSDGRACERIVSRLAQRWFS